MKKVDKISDSRNHTKIHYLRNAVFVINALFTVIAACVFVVATNVSKKYNSYEAFLSSYHFRTVQTLAVSGIISTCLALLGMLGAAKYNSRCLNVQNVFLFALLVMELTVIFTGLYILIDIKEPIETKMLQSLPKAETNEKVRNSWNYVQEESYCCGVNSSEDWYHAALNGIDSNSSHIGGYKKYPFSCCNSYNCSSGNLFQDGCLQHVVNYISKSIKIVTFIPLVVIILQVVLVVSSCLLLKYIKRNKLYQEEEGEHSIYRPHNVSFFISSTSLLDRSRM